MPTIHVVETHLVYRNPKPHLVSRHAYFPSIVALPSGELLCGMDIGSAFEAVDVRSFVCRSSDSGKTWSSPVQMFEPPSSPPFSTSCRLAHVGKGEVVGLISLMDRSRRDEGLSSIHDGFVNTQWALIRSTDAGRTWTPVQTFDPPLDWHAFEICSPVIRVTNKRWIIPTAIWPEWSGHNPIGIKAITLISNDAGSTWSNAVDVMNTSADRIASYEQKQVRLTDGRLLAVCWAMDLKTRTNLPNRYNFSIDEGDTYGNIHTSPLLGETCTPLALPDNQILCAYRRMDQKGLWVHLAQIDGDQWKPIAELPLWGGDVTARQMTGDSLLAQMSTLRFGCPSLTQLPNGEILVVFWGVEDCVSVIRSFRLRIS